MKEQKMLMIIKKGKKWDDDECAQYGDGFGRRDQKDEMNSLSWNRRPALIQDDIQTLFMMPIRRDCDESQNEGQRQEIFFFFKVENFIHDKNILGNVERNVFTLPM